jgi:3-deoxy-manno-octulosonate cytidylyltransferase (CMP-KDO synthetase)
MIVAIIPARYASTRFPGKPLIDILGKPMIQRVYEQVAQCKTIDRVVVATDDKRIFDRVEAFGGEALMTAADHPSGTDRCWEAFRQLKENFQYIINVQGDEPFIDPGQVDELGNVLNNEEVELATQMIAVDDHEVLFDRGEVKIVLNENNEALYFSRMVIPYIKGVEEKNWHEHHTYYRHVGMYAYRADVLKKLTALPVSSLEKAESLEQLRWLQNGFRIRCVLTKYDSHCIDTPEDVNKVLKFKGLI